MVHLPDRTEYHIEKERTQASNGSLVVIAEKSYELLRAS